MKKLLELIGFIAAICALMAFTSFQIDSKGYQTKDQISDIAKQEVISENKELKRDSFYISMNVKRNEKEILIVQKDVKEILKLMLERK